MRVVATHTIKMTLKNFTEGENQKTMVILSCSAEFTAEVQGELIFLSIVNIFLSITAFLGNTLILVALHKETLLHPPFKLLYRNLAVTDFCVGTISEPRNVVYWISVVTGKWDICYLAHLKVTLAAYTFCGVSLLTLTAISLDRLLDLLPGLRYRQVVTVIIIITLLNSSKRLFSLIYNVRYLKLSFPKIPSKNAVLF